MHGPAARAWGRTERILSEHRPNRARLDSEALRSGRILPSTPFMEAHYFQNNCFMKPDQLMAEADKLAGIHGIIVQGRYDLLCPPATSHALAALWPTSEVRVDRRRRSLLVRSRYPRRRDDSNLGARFQYRNIEGRPTECHGCHKEHAQRRSERFPRRCKRLVNHPSICRTNL